MELPPSVIDYLAVIKQAEARIAHIDSMLFDGGELSGLRLYHYRKILEDIKAQLERPPDELSDIDGQTRSFLLMETQKLIVRLDHQLSNYTAGFMRKLARKYIFGD